MTTRIELMTQKLNNEFKGCGGNVTASAWKFGRIYINGLVRGRDTKVYIELEDFDMEFENMDDMDAYFEPTEKTGLLTACAVKVTIKCNQSRKWLANRQKQQYKDVISELQRFEILPKYEMA